MENQKREFVALVVKLFGRSPEEAEREYEQRLSHQFQAASQPEPMAESATPLCVPDGLPELYQGKSKSGEIYSFLQRVYAYREGGEPLSIEFLKENDPRALSAFRNRRQIVTVPEALLGLTDPLRGKRSAELFTRHGVDLSTPEGIDEGKRLMGALGRALYRAP